MNQKEKVGLLAIILAIFNILGYAFQGEHAPWYAIIVLLVGCFLFLFGGDNE